MGPRAGLDGLKISSPAGFDPGRSSPKSLDLPTELPGPQNQEVLLCVYSNSYMSCVYTDWLSAKSDRILPTGSQHNMTSVEYRGGVQTLPRNSEGPPKS